jgi:protocatechuate 3,4-dioxygenase beta subunit
MAANFTEKTSAEVVAASFADSPDPRLREVLTSLVRHLHDFVRDIEPTPEEWAAAIAFLTATGQACTETRQEFILLSDVLGVSMLVDAIAHRAPAGATESTVLGPFHVSGSPPRELGADISLDGEGEPCVITGQVRSLDGTPLPGAALDVWQANGAGFYDVQQPDVQPEHNLRGLFTADTGGRFWFRSVVPVPYPIPDDGPVGSLLHRTGRHPYRPAHVHVIADAPGHRPVTTHVFLAGDPYLDSDTVFGVKQSLVRPLETVADAAATERHNVVAPYRQLTFDIVLQPD